MLRLDGYINILNAIGHILGLIWTEQMFDVTGIGKEMNELAQTHSSLPYLLTIDQTLSHGKEGATNGTINMEKGKDGKLIRNTIERTGTFIH